MYKGYKQTVQRGKKGDMSLKLLKTNLTSLKIKDRKVETTLRCLFPPNQIV